ncbi:hypothetical protein EBU71_20180 [bacterium]|nr:hypothetical protein [Candidatus Elulimicrobium humile]
MEHKIKFFVEGRGKSCGGCTRCCEGFLSTKVYDFEISPSAGGCRFLGKNGCNIYQVRPYDPCQVFQCGWKENTVIPDFMRPDLSDIIILLRYIESYHFYRLVKCSDDLKPEVIEWAKGHAKQGHHVIAYDKNSQLLIFSEDRKFRELARKNYTLGGIL